MTKSVEFETTVAAELTREADSGRWKDLLDASAAVDQADQAQEAAEIAESHELRFVRLFKSVVLAHELQQTGSASVKARFARLHVAEARALLPPADAVAAKEPLAPVPPQSQFVGREAARRRSPMRKGCEDLP